MVKFLHTSYCKGCLYPNVEECKECKIKLSLIKNIESQSEKGTPNSSSSSFTGIGKVTKSASFSVYSKSSAPVVCNLSQSQSIEPTQGNTGSRLTRSASKAADTKNKGFVGFFRMFFS